MQLSTCTNHPSVGSHYFSNGVGRTGIFIAVDTLIQQAREEKSVDVISTILNMRNNRCNMVKTEVRSGQKYHRIKYINVRSFGSSEFVQREIVSAILRNYNGRFV